MKVVIIYNDDKDKELIELSKFSIPFFIEYIDSKTIKGKKESFKLKSPFSAKLDPFIIIYNDEDEFIKCFYSENGNAVQQFVNYLINECKN